MDIHQSTGQPIQDTEVRPSVNATENMAAHTESTTVESSSTIASEQDQSKSDTAGSSQQDISSKSVGKPLTNIKLPCHLKVNDKSQQKQEKQEIVVCSNDVPSHGYTPRTEISHNIRPIVILPDYIPQGKEDPTTVDTVAANMFREFKRERNEDPTTDDSGATNMCPELKKRKKGKSNYS